MSNSEEYARDVWDAKAAPWSAMLNEPPRARDGHSGPCLLVFGVSGVGKTSACKAFVRRHPNFLYLRASALLSEALAASPEQLRTGSAKQIEANQSLLGPQLSAYRASERQRPLLVDVHAVIDNDRDLVRVPDATIASLEPDGLVLLEAPPAEVLARRREDSRPRPTRTLEQIARELALERQVVLEYAQAFALPVELAATDASFALETTIGSLLERLARYRS